jgi:hypothetical protein
VAEFLNEHCVAAYQQVGDFTVTKVDGKVQKNGGNVASYFLIPRGRVIDWGLVLNAVVGPVKADKLLSEAQLAQQLYEQMERPSMNPIMLVKQAHMAQGGDHVHQYLAENPLAPIRNIYDHVFEKLANQKIAQDRSGAMTAAAALEKARKEAKPVLLVLFKGEKKNPTYDRTTADLFSHLGASTAARPAKNCLVIPMPIDELPALSSLADVPAYDLAERTTPTMVLVRPNGEQIAGIKASVDPRVLAVQLWSAVNEIRFDKAQKLIEAGETKAATSYLGMVKSSPAKGPLTEAAKKQWELLRAGKPVQPTTAAAAAHQDTGQSVALDR